MTTIITSVAIILLAIAVLLLNRKINLTLKIEDYALLKKEIKDVIYTILDSKSFRREFDYGSSLSHELRIIATEYRRRAEQIQRLEATNKALLDKLNESDTNK